MRMVENFLDAKDVVVGENTYKISRIPAVPAGELYNQIVKIVLDNGKIGATMFPTAIRRQLFSYCAVKTKGGGWVVLDTEESINNSLKLDEMLQLQVLMYRENFGFFDTGRLTEILGLPKEA